MLTEASIHLTGILLIGPHLTPENRDELLARVRFRTKREIERLVAELAPAPDAPARIEFLHEGATDRQEPTIEVIVPPRRRNTWAAFVRSLAGPVRQLQHGLGAGEAPPATPESNAVLTGNVLPGASAPGAITSHGPVPNAPVAQKANPGPRYRIQFTVDQSFLELLEEARALLQHTILNRDLVEVQRRALHDLVKRLRARKLGMTDRPRRNQSASGLEGAPETVAATAARTMGTPTADVETPSAAEALAPHGAMRAPNAPSTAPARRHHLPVSVRRAVWHRDGACCTYMDGRGQRCRENSGLELHHLEPHARGGPATLENLTLRCRAHNALAAEQDFGRARILEKRSAQRASPC